MIQYFFGILLRCLTQSVTQLNQKTSRKRIFFWCQRGCGNSRLSYRFVKGNRCHFLFITVICSAYASFWGALSLDFASIWGYNITPYSFYINQNKLRLEEQWNECFLTKKKCEWFAWSKAEPRLRKCASEKEFHAVRCMNGSSCLKVEQDGISETPLFPNKEISLN